VVAAHQHLLAGFKLDMKLAQQLRRRAIQRPESLRAKADEARVPAVTEDGSDCVVTVAQQFRYVVSRVLDPLSVVGPSWGQDRVADPLPVDLELEETTSGSVKRRAADRLGQIERTAEARGRNRRNRRLIGAYRRAFGH
jgi:hypothetical protein